MCGEDAKEDDKLPEQQPRIVVLDAADGLAGTGKEGAGRVPCPRRKQVALQGSRD